MEEYLIYENLDDSPFLWHNLAMCESQDNTIQLWMSLTVMFKGLKLKLTVFWTERNAQCAYEDLRGKAVAVLCTGSGH